MKTNCIIVDDEPIAIDVIVSHLQNFPDINIVDRCTNAMNAFKSLQKYKIDLMFLDIHMPKINGLDFLKSLRNPPKVIVTTAYRDYAIEGFELSVVDYLLKPIPLTRFMQAIEKYYDINSEDHNSAINPQPISLDDTDFIYVKSNRKSIKVFLHDILFVESMKDYVVIHTTKEKIITKELISYFEKTLPSKKFLRIHRSYIVSIPKITAVTKTSIEIGKKELPISRNYKTSVFNRLKIN